MAEVIQDPEGTDPSFQMVSPPLEPGMSPMEEPGEPLWARGLQDFKTSPIPAVIGFQGFRGMRTITHGGWAGAGDTSKIRFRDKANPRSWTKFKNTSEFQHEGFINKLFHNSAKDRSGIIGRRFEGEGKVGQWAARRGLTSNGTTNPIWSRNILGRAGGARRLATNYNPTAGSNAADWLTTTAPDMAEHLAGYEGRQMAMSGAMAEEIPMATDLAFEGGNEAAMATMMAGKGTVSQWLSGAMSRNTGQMTGRLAEFGEAERPAFMAGRAWAQKAASYGEGGVKGMWAKASAQAAEKSAAKAATTEGAEAVMGAAGKEVAGTALKTAAKDTAEELAVKGATSAFARLGVEWAGAQVADIIPPLGIAVNTAMAIYTAYTLAKTGAKLAKDLVINPAIHETKMAFNSFKGQLDKSPFGMGYKDNEVSATSRARGVAAIQNSRLNARSILGSEAGGLHAHFG